MLLLKPVSPADSDRIVGGMRGRASPSGDSGGLVEEGRSGKAVYSLVVSMPV
jgi:hypothetical protein